jgi:hypothetical protein
MTDREERLIRVCEIVNRDAEVRLIEEEFDALDDVVDEIVEPWD